MTSEINPPPNEEFQEVEDFDEDGDSGFWHGWPVINGKLAATVTDVESVTIDPNDDHVNGLMGIKENYDDPVDGICLTVRLPDVERWNNLTDAERKDLADPAYRLSDCTTEDEWLFTDPRDVSHGWDSPWHGLAGIKRNQLPDDLPIDALVGKRLLFSGYVGDNGSVEWVMDVGSPLSAAVTTVEDKYIR